LLVGDAEAADPVEEVPDAEVTEADEGAVEEAEAPEEVAEAEEDENALAVGTLFASVHLRSDFVGEDAELESVRSAHYERASVRAIQIPWFARPTW
jgi:hypothetical protein